VARDEPDARARYDDICDALAAWNEDVTTGRVFGMPCLKRAGRVIAGFSRAEETMVFKLVDPEVRERALALAGAHLFDPSGRGEPFREWVVVPPAHAAEWDDLALHALDRRGL